MRSAARIALLVGRRMRTGTSAADSRWATDCRQVNATVISSRRQSRSWNAASVAALAASSRTCTSSAGTPSSANASSTSARLSTSTLTRLRSWPSSRLRPQQGGVQGAAGQRHVGGRARGASRPAGRTRSGTWLANRQASIPGPEPEHLVGGFLLAAVGGGHQPPGRRGADPLAGGHRAGRRGGPAPPGMPGLRAAGQHDPLDQVVRSDDADGQLGRRAGAGRSWLLAAARRWPVASQTTVPGSGHASGDPRSLMCRRPRDTACAVKSLSDPYAATIARSYIS